MRFLNAEPVEGDTYTIIPADLSKVPRLLLNCGVMWVHFSQDRTCIIREIRSSITRLLQILIPLGSTHLISTNLQRQSRIYEEVRR